MENNEKKPVPLAIPAAAQTCPECGVPVSLHGTACGWENAKGSVSAAQRGELINCLAYALRFWKKEPSFKIYYCSGHAINSHVPITVDGWLPAEDFGYGYFSSAFNGLLDEHETNLLKKYFNQ